MLTLKYPEAKKLSRPFLTNGGPIKKKNQKKREKYATISSLNKGSPSSEVHVSRKKLQTAKTDYAKITDS